MTAVVIGVGNEFRRDDGVGPAVAAQLSALRLPGVRVLTCPAEPTAVLDAWAGAALAIVVDGALGDVPGRIRQCAPADLEEPAAVSSHDLSLRQTYDLGLVLQQVPAALRIVTVGIADTGHGVGLSPDVAAALPGAVRAVRSLLGPQPEETAYQQP